MLKGEEEPVPLKLVEHKDATDYYVGKRYQIDSLEVALIQQID